MNTSVGIIIIIACLIMSAFFSSTETAFSSLNRIRIKSLAEKGDKRAALVLRLADQYDKLLSTILIGNNIVNIASASVATVLFIRWAGEETGPSLSTIVTTVVVLIFGEISPKTLAKESPELFARLSAPIIQVLIYILTPINFLFVQWKKLLSLVFKTAEDTSISEEELLTMVDEAESEGGIDEQEGDLIRSAIEFSDVEVVEIFTPRVNIVGISENTDNQTIAKLFKETGFSRLPVYRDSIDNIVGIIHEKDFYNEVAPSNRSIDVIVKPPIFVAKTMKIGELLKMLQKNKSHIAVVADEYGGTLGIVTLEDVLEELVGEIWDEHDRVVEQCWKTGNHEYLARGAADFEDVLTNFGYENDEAADTYTTVNGWMIDQLEHIPKQGETLTYKNLDFVVQDADDRHVLLIKIIEHENCETPTA
ncbi:HlyC/CorC family transporter [Candidatus Agathobaculum pullicola]|uniref:HlyC/CorC family transporter n=1 Tax=Candidatus Agathobaculum pullicola TaxID=2838426 RepID=UPI003F8FCA01